MMAAGELGRPVNGRIDADGRLTAADAPLAELQTRAGGSQGGPLAIPQIASLARLAQRLGITISRPAIAADGERTLNLWVRAQPVDGAVSLEITGWEAQPPAQPPAPTREREADFERAGADWMWETDEALRLTSLSHGALSAIGQPAHAVMSQALTQVFRLREGEDGVLPILAALAERRAFDGQVAESRGGAAFRLSGTPLIDGAGRFAGFRGAAQSLAMGSDAALADGGAPADNAFGERLDQALRRPLNHIIRNAEFLRAQPEGALRDDYGEYAGDIAAAGRHLLALIDDLVDLQAIERPGFTPEREPIDLADLARRAAQLLKVRAGERNVRVDVPADGERLPAFGDFTRTLQIVMNLLTNAIRYSPEGGMVWVRTEREGDLACLIVADQGHGIAPENQARIFEKFERVDPGEPGGTGLGLYIARHLARAMGGGLNVDSAPGQGARFLLTLPAR